MLTALCKPGRAIGFEVDVPLDGRNRNLVAALLTDAEEALALTHFEDVRGNREFVEQTIVRVRRNYDDLLRRGRSITMSGEERTAFQESMDRLRAALRFFGEAV